jgi:hypothetical protein
VIVCTRQVDRATIHPIFHRVEGSVHVADSHWSNGGTPVNSSDGHLPGVNFSGTSSDWLVTRVTIHDHNDHTKEPMRQSR